MNDEIERCGCRAWSKIVIKKKGEKVLKVLGAAIPCRLGYQFVDMTDSLILLSFVCMNRKRISYPDRRLQPKFQDTSSKVRL